MTSRLFHSFFILFFILLLVAIFCFDRTSSTTDLVKYETKSEWLVKNFNSISKNSLSNDTIQALDACPQISNVNSGYIFIRRSYDARLFYFFFESRGSERDPVVLMLNGGPGSGSAGKVFYGPGPFRINDDLSLKWNDLGWNKVCNILFVDQQIGTGFSYSSDNRDIRRNSVEVSKDLYDFLQAFFQAHPKYVQNDFYIVGGSYAGHTIPLLASELHQKNKAKKGIHINIKGLSITNGLTNPEYTYSSYPDFVYANKLVSIVSHRLLKKFSKTCLTSIRYCQADNNVCEDAYKKCDSFFRRLIHISGNRYVYNIRKHKNNILKSDWSNLDKLFNLDHVKRALGVENREYVKTSDKVRNDMTNDHLKNYAGVIPQLLEDGIKLLIFDGEYDLICNWLGNIRWMEAMKWSGRTQFLKTQLTSYKIDGKKVGKVKNSGPLTFVKVFAAGHSVPFAQPNISLQIFKNWINS